MSIDSLKDEVVQVLDRYEIPMDDKSFIIEKIEGHLHGVVEQAVRQVQEQRARDKEQVESLQGQARHTVQEVLSKAQEAVRKAHQLGIKEGLAQAPEPESITRNWFFWFQVATGLGVITLAGFMIYWQFWKKSD